MESLKNFTAMVQYGDLPDAVIYEIKRLFLDSIGCAVAGLTTERGRIAVNLAGKLGGTTESTIIGTANKVSCTNAAFVNGELINAMEFEPVSEGGVRDVPCLVAAMLAMAERCETSGKDLILAMALSLEISARLQSALVQIPPAVAESDKKSTRISAIIGFGSAALAASAGVSRIMNLDRERIANAIGISGGICPPNSSRKFLTTSPIRMIRYGSGGWAAQAGVTSALLAETGYTGYTDLFEGEYSFWQYSGQDQPRTAEEVFADLGAEWYSQRISYKQYPVGFCLAGVLDNFIRVMKENDIKPEEIELVDAQPSPITQFDSVSANPPQTPDDYFYSLPYTLACAAYGINPARWHDLNVMEDQRIGKFMQRVKFNIVFNEKDYGVSKNADPRSDMQGVKVVAQGKSYSARAPFQKGRWCTDEMRTDDELTRKFTDNTSRILPSDKVNQAIRNILELESLENTAELMQIVTP